MKKLKINLIGLLVCIFVLQNFALAQQDTETKIKRDAKKNIVEITNLMGGYFDECDQKPKVYSGIIASVYWDAGMLEDFKLRVGKSLYTIRPAVAPNMVKHSARQQAVESFLKKNKKISATAYLCDPGDGGEKRWLADTLKLIK